MKKRIIMWLSCLLVCIGLSLSASLPVFAAAEQNNIKTAIREIKETGEGKVRATWGKKAVDGYQVQWSLKSDMSGRKTASTTKTTWYRSGLIGGKTYYFAVRTYKLSDGKKVYSPWSAVKSLKLKILPGKSYITSVTDNSNAGFIAKWKKLSTVKGYQLRYSTDGSFATKKTASTVYGGISKSSLPEGRYYVSVRTYDVAADGTKYYSAWSDSKSVEVSISVDLSETEAELATGESVALQATVKGSSKNITWRSGNPSVASVSSTGVIKGLKAGTTVITAEANGKTARCTVKVTDGFDLRKAPGFARGLLMYLSGFSAVIQRFQMTHSYPNSSASRKT